MEFDLFGLNFYKTHCNHYLLFKLRIYVNRNFFIKQFSLCQNIISFKVIILVLTCIFILQVCIKQAAGLPPSLSHFVFCQYQFWGQTESEVVAPVVNNEFPAAPTSKDSMTFKVVNTSYFLFSWHIIRFFL